MLKAGIIIFVSRYLKNISDRNFVHFFIFPFEPFSMFNGKLKIIENPLQLTIKCEKTKLMSLLSLSDLHPKYRT